MTQPQLSLFEKTPVIAQSAIAGLHYFPHYIDHSHAEFITNNIDNQIWIKDLKRRVQHYGYRYDYKARNIASDAKLGALPEWLSGICNSLCCDNLFFRIPDQVIVNEYEPGQGIAAHVDCIPCFEKTIASLSLGSSCVMDFTHKIHGKVSLLLEPQSLLVISGEARYDWQHAIAHRKIDRHDGKIYNRGRRISLTFRNVILAN